MCTQGGDEVCQRAYLGTSAMHTEIRWHPELPEPAVAFRNLRVDNATKDLQELNGAIRLLIGLPQELDEARKRSSGPVPDFKDADELRSAVVRAIRAEWLRNKSKPTLPGVARYFSRQPDLPSSSGGSLRKRIKRAGLVWEELLEEGRPTS